VTAAIGTIPKKRVAFVPWPWDRISSAHVAGSTGALPFPTCANSTFSHTSPRWPTSLKAARSHVAQTVDHALHGTGTERLKQLIILRRKIDISQYPPENGADYPKSPHRPAPAKQIALMIKGRTSGWK